VGRRGEVGGVGGAGEIDHARGTPDIVCPVTQRDSSDWDVSAVRFHFRTCGILHGCRWWHRCCANAR